VVKCNPCSVDLKEYLVGFGKKVPTKKERGSIYFRMFKESPPIKEEATTKLVEL